MNRTRMIMEKTDQFSVRNYDRYPVVFVGGEGVWLWDAEGNRYLDMLSAYSATNYGHCHPRMLSALINQAKKLDIISGNYYNDQHAEALRLLHDYFGKYRILFSNGGVDSVEAAFKIARKWGVYEKGIRGVPEIIACHGQFHGRTIAAVSFSDEPSYKDGFGPFPEGLKKKVKFGDPDALGRAITKNAAAFIVEPIQGEGGINIPPAGYLREVSKICRKKNVLLIIDEIQTGFGRTGVDFCYQYESIDTDMIILGKSISGGLCPVSALLGDDRIMRVIGFGHHGSTFGGNPIACALAVESFSVLKEEKMSERSMEMGAYFMSSLEKIKIKSPFIKEVRGRGLFIGVEVFAKHKNEIHEFCTRLLKEGIACTGARNNTIRFTPPLVISRENIDRAMPRIEKVFREWRGM